MRIISGKNRGRQLKTLEGMNTRPTLDRVKESLFNIIYSKILDAKVLDLFAGSGALGLECISRGAKLCVFVDNSKEAIAVIKKNVELCGAKDKAEIRNMDYELAIKKSLSMHETFDLIFVDPPYSKEISEDVLNKIEPLLADNGMLIIETDEKDFLSDKVGSLLKSDVRRYGRTIISFFVREG